MSATARSLSVRHCHNRFLRQKQKEYSNVLYRGKRSLHDTETFHGSTLSATGDIEITDKKHFNKDDPSVDYLTNDGIVEGVWMFARHGDRTPSRPLSPEHRQDEEAAFWVTRLPVPDTWAAYEGFSRYFPLQVHPPPVLPPHVMSSLSDPNYQLLDKNQGRFVDAARNPFGWLTEVGVQQLSENGHRFFNRYNHHGYHFPDKQDWRWDVAKQDFLSVWDVDVYSTNYLRTVMSVQSFLDGMLGTHCYQSATPLSEKNMNHSSWSSVLTDMHQHQQHRHLHQMPSKSRKMTKPEPRKFDPSIQKEERVPNHSKPSKAIVANDQESRQSRLTEDHLVPIQVRDLSNDPLNAFDRNPDLIAELVSEVMLSEEFLSKDGKAAPLASKLARILPGLIRHKNVKKAANHPRSGPQDVNTKNADFATRTPSGINWVEAADHFVCRAAHGVALSRFSDFEDDQEIEKALQSMAHETISHLSWRFRQWYKHDRLLAAIAAPPLREVANQLMQTPDLGVHEQRPFVIYSCHDITILGLLYAVGAEFLADDDSGDWRYWPPYGSNLVFELVRIREGAPGPDSHVVRILLNGKPIVTVDLAKTNKEKRPHYTGNGPQRMLHVNDFVDIISKLEDAGGHDYEELLGYR